MTQVTPAMIKEIRERTGVGMGKCKEALEEAKGDMELAIANLRKAGVASAVKKEGRATNEGLIGSAEAGSTVAIVEVNAETDFVIKNDRFQEFLQNVADEVAKTNPASLESFLAQKYSKDNQLTVDEYRATVVQTIGENIQIRRIKTIQKSPDSSLGVYNHQAGKLITVVELKGSNQDVNFAKELAMHVAAASPEFLAPEKVPAATLESEKEIARSQIKGKPENIVEKIVDGKIKAYYDENCFVCQKYIRESDKTVAEVVDEHGKKTGKPIEIVSFLRWGVGGS